MVIINPKLQLNIFGYDKLFNSFTTLYKKNKRRYFIIDNSRDSRETEKIILRKFVDKFNK